MPRLLPDWAFKRYFEATLDGRHLTDAYLFTCLECKAQVEGDDPFGPCVEGCRNYGDPNCDELHNTFTMKHKDGCTTEERISKDRITCPTCGQNLPKEPA